MTDAIDSGSCALWPTTKQESDFGLPMGSLYELAMLVVFEIIVWQLLRRTGKSFGAANDRHTNLE